MWLDRLAGNQSSASGPSTPQPASRTYSPLPRRVSSSLSPYASSQRAGHSPRSSSLSLASNDSSTSLLSSSRRPAASGLRQASTAYDGPDPLELLGQLLGAEGDGAVASDAPRGRVEEDDLEFDPDFGGLSLQELAASETEDSEPAPRATPHTQSVADYEKQRSKFDDLHRSINACDDVLRSVETYLTSFQNDLAAVSADIEFLQTRSTTLNRRLDNRKAVEKALGPVVEELSISPEVIFKVAEGHIDESWAKILNEIDRRSVALGNKQSRSATQQIKASEDLGPLLEKLTAKAIERIRDFLVAQIKALRSPHINAQILQQQNFLRFKDLFTFLHKHHGVLAEEIALAYMNTMRWYYLNQFNHYEKALAKIKLHVLDKNDALGQEDMSRRATVLTGSRVAGAPHDAFNLGRRIDILGTRHQAALSSYLAEEDQSTHYLEVPFRNFNLALVDNATAEYTFMVTFFSPALSYAKISKNFNYIFEPTFELGQNLSKNLIGETYDALGLLLCIRLNQRFAFELQRRKVPALDGYVNGTNMLLWPRLQVIMDRHCESVRQLVNTMPSKPSADQARLSAAPHVVTQRFGQLLHGFLSLSTDAGDDEPVVASLRRLRNEVETFLNRQAEMYAGEGPKSERFLYNNISLILTIISDVSGKLAADQQDHFEEVKKRHQNFT